MLETIYRMCPGKRPVHLLFSLHRRSKCNNGIQRQTEMFLTIPKNHPSIREVPMDTTKTRKRVSRGEMEWEWEWTPCSSLR